MELGNRQMMVRMDLADDIPNPESIRIEQEDIITQTQKHQMDQVRQQEEMLNRIDEYQHLSDNPQSTETKYIRDIKLTASRHRQNLSISSNYVVKLHV